MTKAKTNKLTKSQTKAIAILTQVLYDSKIANEFKVVASKKSAILNMFSFSGRPIWNDWYIIGRRGAVAHKGNM